MPLIFQMTPLPSLELSCDSIIRPVQRAVNLDEVAGYGTGGGDRVHEAREKQENKNDRNDPFHFFIPSHSIGQLGMATSIAAMRRMVSRKAITTLQ